MATTLVRGHLNDSVTKGVLQTSHLQGADVPLGGIPVAGPHEPVRGRLHATDSNFMVPKQEI